MTQFKFDCGCTIPILDEKIKPNDGLPSLTIPYNEMYLNLNYSQGCKATWDLISNGYTKGVFQLETKLGENWAEQLKPDSLDEIAALISIIRPGVLKALLDGKSLTKHYVDRKHNIEPITYINDELALFLEKTKGILVFQESAIRIAQGLAGFNEQEADILRKGIGHKLPEVIASLKKPFLEGIKKVGLVSEEEGSQIFDWIEKSNRYSFNRCLTWETKVQNQAGNKISLYDLKVGDYILAPNQSLDGNELVKVKRKYFQGVQDIYRIYSGDNFIDCTINHKFLRFKTYGLNIPLDIVPLYKCLMDGNYIWTKNLADKSKITKIDTIDYLGKKETMDIEVENDHHLFWANNFAVSNSHACAYGMTSYMSAWVKQHFPLHFFCSWLTYSKYKIKPYKHRRELIMEAKRFDISVNPPSTKTIFDQESDVCINDNNLYLGIKSVKKVGAASLKKLISKIKDTEIVLGRSINQWTWFEFLTHIATQVSSTAINNLVCCGVFNDWNLTRQRMLYEYEIFRNLTDREMKGILNIQPTSLTEGLNKLLTVSKKDGGPANEARRAKIVDIIKVLDNPPNSLDDSPRWVITQEKELLGLPLSYSKVDTLPSNYCVNTTCREFNDGKNGENLSIAVEITAVREWTIKSGKNAGQTMCFVTCEDSTDEIDCVLFNDLYEKDGHLLVENNTIVLVGTRSKKNSFLIQKIFEI